MDETDVDVPENKNLLVLIHGFRSNSVVLSGLGKLLARTTGSNVALVDWSKWAKTLSYDDLVYQLPVVSGYITEWMKSLSDRCIVNSTFAGVTLIGHSLGAQMVGYVGHRLNGTVSRIVALDPAQPCFKKSQKYERLNTNSAQFVMVLHTSTTFLGLREPVGHVDFYFNGGQFQPSCTIDTFCGHVVVLFYLSDSLENPKAFPAFQCNNVNDCEMKIVDTNKPTVYMNINVPVSTRGLYSIVTEFKDYQFYQRFFNNL